MAKAQQKKEELKSDQKMQTASSEMPIRRQSTGFDPNRTSPFTLMRHLAEDMEKMMSDFGFEDRFRSPLFTIGNFLENSEAKMAFVGEGFIKKLHEIEEQTGRKVPAVVLEDIESLNSFEKFSDWAKTARPSDFDAKPTPAKPADLAVLMYTSGTTGTPKGVPLTHGNIFYEATGCQEVMHFSEKEVVLSVLPLFHVFAQVVNLWVVAIIGGTICYVKDLTPAELEKGFQTRTITALTGVPPLR